MTQERKAASAEAFNEQSKAGLYQAIYMRRDIRSQFIGRSIPPTVIARILDAAHHAPSVGFMQPWNFILIRDRDIRKSVHAAFERANAEAALMFTEAKRGQYRDFKLEGILESALNICVTCDRERFGPVVIGRTANRIMDLFSSVCAVQNLWLAARAEGIGVGWVSVVHDRDLKEILKLPHHVAPIAYLCLGYVTHFPDKPELEEAGWLPRLALEELVFDSQWGNECQKTWPGLYEAILSQKNRERAGE